MALLSSSTASVALASRGPPAGQVRVHGVYANSKYGFRFAAPPGAEVVRARAPSPDHGASVVLGRGRRIEVSASFDAAEYGSTAALMSARLPQGFGFPHHAAAILGGRPAEKAAYEIGEDAHVVVVRREGGVEDGVNYTVELTSIPAFRQADLKTLDRLLATFRFTILR